MAEINLRDYKDDDLKKCYSLIPKMWEYHKLLEGLKKENIDIIYKGYFQLFLCESEYRKVVEDSKGNFLGFMLAKNNKEKTIKQRLEKLKILIYYFIKIYQGKLGDKKKVGELVKLQDEIYEKIIPKNEGFDSEIELFLLDEKARGRGIGKMLMDDYLNRYCRLKKHKKIILFTDEMCTYSFYEKYGFKRYKEEKCEDILKKVMGNNAFSYVYNL